MRAGDSVESVAHLLVDDGLASLLVHALERGAEEVPVVIDDGEGLLHLDPPRLERAHMLAVETDLRSFAEGGAVAKWGVQRVGGHGPPA